MATRIRLFDRVYLTAIQSDKFKTGCFSVNFVRPLRADDAAQNALIPSVLLGGSERHPDIRSISVALDTLYGASVGSLIRKKGEVQAVGLYADYIEDALVAEPVFAPLCSLVAELLFKPLTENGGFCPRVFENERDNLINAMRSALNNKQSYANLQLLRAMCQGEPYGIPYHGGERDLERVTPASLYAHYQHVLQQSNVEVFYMGREEAQNAAACFRDMLAPLAGGTGLLLKRPENPMPAALRHKRMQMPLAQSKLAIGCRCAQAYDEKTLAQMLCFAVLFGGGSGSKLFTNVREALSLCYYASASYDKFKGILRIASGIARENHDAACAEIYRQLALCADGSFSEQELATAKRLLLTQLRSDLDSPARLDEFYLGQSIQGAQFSLEVLMQQIEQVCAEDVCRAAAGVRPDTEFFLEGVSE